MTRLGLALVLVLALVLTIVGVQTGLTTQDEDERIYVNTLRSMQDGNGYYDSFRDALTEKTGTPPSTVRAIRLPTMFLFLRWFPESTWRWVVGLVFLAILLLVWTLARVDGAIAGIAAAVIAFVWLAPASPYLFLHAELWGLPFFLAGLWNARQGRDGAAAALIGGAALVRELFAPALLIGLIVRRRREWFYANLGFIGAMLIHMILASRVLLASGSDPELSNVPISPALIFQVIGPGTTALSVIVGMVVLGLGIPGLFRHARLDDASARMLLPFALVLVAAGIVATRIYWSLTWGPALAAFVPSGVMVLAAMRRNGNGAPAD